MTKQTYVRVGGDWKPCTNIWVRAGGVWKSETIPTARVSGQYKECMSYGYKVGDVGPSGGYIGYVDTANSYSWKYLEVAPSAYWGSEKSWGDSGTVNNSYSSNGRTQTQYLYDNFNSAAANHCLQISFSNGGVTYNDWHLPFTFELGFVLQELYINKLEWTSSDNFWSSFGGSTWHARYYTIWLGEVYLDSMDRTSQIDVLPIRYIY